MVIKIVVVYRDGSRRGKIGPNGTSFLVILVGESVHHGTIDVRVESLVSIEFSLFETLPLSTSKFIKLSSAVF
jgi:hypothetical protein